MKANYKPFVDRMIDRYEGGYGWDAGDPGGPTKYGITCWDLAQHRGKRMNSMSAWAPLVRAMTLAEAEGIYATRYATAVQFDALNSGPDCAVFDFTVNSGNWGIKYAQRVAGAAVDGILGPKTLAGINGMNPLSFVNKLCDYRLAFLHSLGTWNRFGNGWSSRVSDLRSYCRGLTTAAPATLIADLDDQFVDKSPMSYAKAWHPEYIAETKQEHQEA